MVPPVCYFPFPTFCFDIGAKSKFHPVRDASRSWLLRTCSRGLSSFVRPKRSERRSAVDRALGRARQARGHNHGHGAREPRLVLQLLKRMVRERAVPPSGQASIACPKVAQRGESHV
jgi:hypothetical protein